LKTPAKERNFNRFRSSQGKKIPALKGHTRGKREKSFTTLPSTRRQEKGEKEKKRLTGEERTLTAQFGREDCKVISLTTNLIF